MNFYHEGVLPRKTARNNFTSALIQQEDEFSSRVLSDIEPLNKENKEGKRKVDYKKNKQRKKLFRNYKRPSKSLLFELVNTVAQFSRNIKCN